MIRELGCELIVATPTSGKVSAISMCGMPYRSNRFHVQGEPYMLANGGIGCDFRDGLVVKQPHCH